MAKAYLIGGSPRVGKTTLSISVLKDHPMLGVSTDSIRYLLREIVTPYQSPGLFVLKASDLSENELIKRLTEDSQLAIRYQNEESSAVWKSTKDIVAATLLDGFDILVEGVAVLPENVSQLDIPYSAVFLGNQADGHIETTLDTARTNPYDWLGKKSEAVAESFCMFNQNFSSYIEAECQKYNQAYVEMDDNNFHESLTRAKEVLLSK